MPNGTFPFFKKGFILLVLNYSLFTISFGQQPELVPPIGHSEDIFSTEATPDGKYIITCAYDNTAKIWDGHTGRIYSTIDRLLQSIGEVINVGIHTQMSEDGRYLYSLKNGKITKFEIPDGNIIYSVNNKDSETVSSFQLTGDSKYLMEKYREWAGSSKDVERGLIGEFISIRDASTGKFKYQVGGYDSYSKNSKDIKYFEFNPDSKTFLKIVDSSLDICNIQSGKTMVTLENVPNFGEAFFIQNGRYVVIFPKKSNLLRIWDINKDTVIQIRASGKVIFSPDGQFILAYSQEYMQMIDAKNGNVLYTINESIKNSLMPEFSGDGKYIFLVEKPRDRMFMQHDSVSVIWNASTGNPLFRLHNEGSDIYDILFDSFNKYIVTVSVSKINIWDSFSGKLLRTILKQVPNVRFSPDGRNLIITSNELVDVYNIKSNTILTTLEGHCNAIIDGEFSKDKDHLITVSHENYAHFWKLSEGRIEKTFKSASEIKSAHLIADGKKIVIETQDNKLLFIDVESGNLLFTLNGPVKSIKISEDSKLCICTLYDSSVEIWDISGGKCISKIKENYNVDMANISPDNNTAAILTKQGVLSIWDVSNPYPKHMFNLDDALPEDAGNTGKNSDKIYNTDPDMIKDFRISPNNKYLITNSEKGSIKLWETKTGNLIKQLCKKHQSSRAVSYISGEENHNDWEGEKVDYFSMDGNYIITRSDYGQFVVWNAKKLKVIGTISEDADILDIQFLPNPKYLAALLRSNRIDIWQIDKKIKKVKTLDGNGFSISPFDNSLMVINSVQLILYRLFDYKVLFKAIALNNDDYLIRIPDKPFYRATKKAMVTLAFKFKNEIFSFDQFDLKYNRPDLVLKNIGNTDTTLITSYYKAYKKRINRAGFTEEMLSGELHTPDTYIVNKDSLDYNTSSDYVNLSIHAIDSLYKLDRILVWVNDVPVYGINGISLRNKNELTQTFNIMLSKGENNVEVSCMNEHGAESTRESVTINYEPKDSIIPKVYFLGIGVQHFKDSAWNLTYSVKDIRDLSKAIKERYPDAIIDTLLNNNVTKENVIAEKQKLLHTNINDLVILSISGHGLLSDSLDFYYGSYDIDFRHPERRGISFDTIQWLLDSIPARNKLVLMDACHSGEVDKDGRLKLVYTTPIKTQGYVHEVASGSRGAEILEDSNSTSLQNSFDLMQQLFTDLNRGNGAIVISAAGGKEYAYESTDWNNGVFTYCVLKGLKDLSQTNADKSVTVTQLKNYVSQKVEELTGGKQKPTSRVDNLENDFKIW